MPETVVVFTAIFGAIPDELRRPGHFRPDPGVKYVCFTDRPESFPRSQPWELRPACWSHPSARRTARYHKVLSHVVLPEADVTLWLDGNLRLNADPRRIIRDHLADGVEIATFRHAQRSSVYEELEACIRLEKDEAELMRRQVDRYRAEGYPSGNGLAETTAFLRRHSPAVRAFNEAWWREIEGGSLRDQLSVDYAAWKAGLRYAWLPGWREKSPYFKFSRHR